MGGEVHDHADVGDAVRERALAAGDDLVDLAELAGLQPGAQALQRRVVALDVADAGDQAARPRTPRPGGGPPRRCRASGFSISAQTPAVGQLEADLLVQRRSGRRPRRSRCRARSARRRSARPARPQPRRSVSPAGSTTPTSSTPSSPDSTRAWLRPIAPRPIRPARSVRLVGHAAPPALFDGVDDPLQLVRGQRRDRPAATAPRRRPARSPAGPSAAGLAVLGQVRPEPVDRRRVVDRAADARARSACACAASRSPGHPDRVLVVDVPGAVGDRRRDQRR